MNHFRPMNWKRLLAYIAGSVGQELLLRNELLVTENRILKNQIKGRLPLTDLERISLAEIGKRLGRRALEEVAQIVRPETILGWHRKLIARKFDGAKQRTPVGGPAIGQMIDELVPHFAQENRSWGYQRIVGAQRDACSKEFLITACPFERLKHTSIVVAANPERTADAGCTYETASRANCQ